MNSTSTAIQALAIVGPLIGVVLGGLLTWLHQFVKERRELKGHIGTALSDLLEIRHGLWAVDSLIAEAKKHANLPAEAVPIVREMVEKMFHQGAALATRYDEAVNLIAKADPVLAFRLRSQSTLPDMMSQWRSTGRATGGEAADIESFEVQGRQVAIPYLNLGISLLAMQLSKKVQREVAEILNQKSDAPPDIVALFKSIGLPHNRVAPPL